MSESSSTDIEFDESVTEYSYTDLIENQITVITTMCELENVLYDTIDVDRIKAVSMAMKIIHKSQRAILDSF